MDLLRRPELRASLLEELEGVDRLVLLGDVLELRHGPPREAIAAARDVFADLGRAMAGREIIVLAGNHDHGLVEPWLAARSTSDLPSALATEQRFAPGDASPALVALAEAAAPAELTCAYPGVWLRPDVYATHGHYLDLHITVPTIERLGLGLMSLVVRRPPARLTGPDDYEAVMSPLFAWLDAIAREAPSGDAVNGQLTIRAWRALRPAPGRRRTLGSRAFGALFPLMVATLSRAGLGPLRSDISRNELERAGLRAMSAVVEQLDLGAGHIIFGHTHRPGPLAGDDWHDWTAPTGARLHNCGCWSFDGFFIGERAGESPYWPGNAILVEDGGPPLVRPLLADRTRSQLSPGKVARAAA